MIYALFSSAGDCSVLSFLPDTDGDADKSLCQGTDAASEMGMDLFGFVRSADGGSIKDSQSAFDECFCNGLDQYWEYLDVLRTSLPDKKIWEL